MESLKVAIVSSALNEAGNIRQLYERCISSISLVAQEYADKVSIDLKMTVADNASTDNSRDVLRQLHKEDERFVPIYNISNYGPEVSIMNALQTYKTYDIVVLISADLQDPPELVSKMISVLIDKTYTDAALGVKNKSVGSRLTRIGRHTYYKSLNFASRLRTVPSGFHGFGCYRREVIDQIVAYWENTNLTLRQCIINATQAPIVFPYIQMERVNGASSYSKLKYFKEAIQAIVNADASTSRICMATGLAGVGLAAIVIIFIVINKSTGHSNYAGGVATLVVVSLFSFSIQIIMVALLSRQVERLRVGVIRPKVRIHTD
jgi:glycosyltransferase involved in cell wall biosynthesis